MRVYTKAWTRVPTGISGACIYESEEETGGEYHRPPREIRQRSHNNTISRSESRLQVVLVVPMNVVVLKSSDDFGFEPALALPTRQVPGRGRV